MSYVWYTLLALYVLGVLFLLRSLRLPCAPWWHRLLVIALWPIVVPIYVLCVAFNDGGHL